MVEKLVTTAQFPGYIQAGSARQLFAGCRMKAVVTAENASSTCSVPAVKVAEQQVFESRANEAHELFESHREREQ
jgi:hypothetical protein